MATIVGKRHKDKRIIGIKFSQIDKKRISHPIETRNLKMTCNIEYLYK